VRELEQPPAPYRPLFGSDGPARRSGRDAWLSRSSLRRATSVPCREKGTPNPRTTANPAQRVAHDSRRVVRSLTTSMGAVPLSDVHEATSVDQPPALRPRTAASGLFRSALASGVFVELRRRPYRRSEQRRPAFEMTPSRARWIYRHAG
jgi:hypothetical protein